MNTARTELSPLYSRDRDLETAIFENPVSYDQGYRLQKELHREVSSGEIDDQLLLLEHSPVYTLGKRGEDSDFLLPRQAIADAGADIVEIDRGGQITFHGPGQIVLYIISNLGNRSRSIRRFVELLEETVIVYLKEQFAIEAGRDPDHPGVWVSDAKIAALGISIHEKTTMHGFALNITTDLRRFDAIIPCGIRDRGVCSVESLLNAADRIGDLDGRDIHGEMRTVADIFHRLYGYEEMRIEMIH